MESHDDTYTTQRNRSSTSMRPSYRDKILNLFQKLKENFHFFIPKHVRRKNANRRLIVVLYRSMH